MTIPAATYIWMNGTFVPWEAATVHVLAHGLHYGTGVFEGIRCYDTSRGPAVFRLDDHLRRLHRSARVVGLPVSFSARELQEVVVELIRKNGLRSCYVRPVAFRGYGALGLNPSSVPVDVAVAAWQWGTYLGDAAIRDGVRVTFSSWKRNDPNVIPPDSKITGAYVTSCLATTQANAAGFDEALMLDQAGFVAEGAGENVFVVEGGRLLTPPVSSGILPGVTRDTVIALARDAGVAVVETLLTRSDLYAADEAFCVGTAAEIVPIREVDGYDLAAPGPLTATLQERFFEVVNGRDDKYGHWLMFVDDRNRRLPSVKTVPA